MSKPAGKGFRCLETGKWYRTPKDAKRAKGMRAYRNKVATVEEMTALSKKAQTPEAKAKKSKSLKLYFNNNPGEFSRRITMAYAKNPELRQQRATVLRITRSDMENYYTDPKNAEKRRSTRNGEQVVKYIEAEREKTTGVLVYDES